MRKILPFLLFFILQRSAAQNFTPGNLAVLQAASATANNTTCSVLEINSSTASQSSPVRSIAVDGNTIRVSGSASSTLYAANSDDGTLFCFTGHYASTASGNANAILPRAVVTVDNTGAVATPTTYTGSSGNQTRCASSVDNNSWYIADQGGLYTNSGTSPSPVGNFRGIKTFGGVVYVGQQSATTTNIQIATVASPSGGTITGLPGLTNNSTFQDFYLISSGSNGSSYDVLYVLSSTSATVGTIAKYSLLSGTWTADGTYTTTFGGFGLAARRTGNGAYLYATTGVGATAANSVIRLTDAAGYNAPINITTTDNLTLYTTSASATLKGLAFAPTASVNNLSLSFSSTSSSGLLQPPAASTVLNDATDPSVNTGISVDVKDNGVTMAATDYTLTAASNNTGVVANGNVIVTKTNGQATIKITAGGVGYADVTLTLTKGGFSKTLVINVAASAASNTPAATKFHTGSSDASAAIALDDNYMIVADDEMNKLFMYNRKVSGLPATSFDYSSLLNLSDLSGGVPREVSTEAGVKSISNTGRIYWLGSMSNSASSFNDRPNRNRLFAVTATGTGAATNFSVVGYYSNLRQDLIAWGDAAGYDFSSSAATGKDPKLIDGFSVEGLTFAPNNTTAYVAFRAPLVPAANRTKAVIAPILNFEAWFNNGSPSASPTIGSPIELDLGGRGFRDIVRLSNGRYVILAGNYGDTPLNPAIYSWNGSSSSAPVQLTSFNLTGLNPEGVMEIQASGNLQTDRLQVVNDNGDNVYYDDGIAAKDLAQNNFKKFRSDVLVSSTGGVLPLNLKSFTVEKGAGINLLQWTVASPAAGDRFEVERSVNGADFIVIGSVAAFANTEDYSFSDAFTVNGNVYYRLAMVEASGRKTYSPVRLIKNGKDAELVVYPNPVNRETLSFSVAAGGLKYATLLDGSGKRVKTMSFTGNASTLTIEGLPKGMYYLVVSTKEKIIETKSILLQ